ncbi:hypothetical protein PCH_Pc18g01900 [Penicillium rubens Wisconsin 54-1255]|uniref:Uncharacterized protein n=1 Tax=Penicillium rubens (strain ATCC 28089 / DSM 1075 / NRRL 1951 / Wisconsin 54-1255) TaxID=500485 RepID=B6HCL1_PENRW|nr:hypothetical protein PCH_Pc18g01900 [Penicillium rubens Wisconsin 54-1255]
MSDSPYDFTENPAVQCELNTKQEPSISIRGALQEDGVGDEDEERKEGLPQGKSVPGVLYKEGTIRKVSIKGTLSPDIATPNPHSSDGKCSRQGNVRLRVRSQLGRVEEL